MSGWLGRLLVAATGTGTVAWCLAHTRHPDAATWVGVLALLVVGAAVWPDSLAGVATILAAAAWWLTAPGSRDLEGSLVVGLLLLAFHAATGLSASLPVRGRVTWRAVGRLVAAWSAVAALALAGGVIMVAIAGQHTPVMPDGPAWLLLATLTFIAAVAGITSWGSGRP